MLVLSYVFSFTEDCKPKKCPGDGFQGKRCKCWCRGSSDNVPVEACEKEGNITLTHLWRMDFSILIIWMSRDSFIGALGVIFHFR